MSLISPISSHSSLTGTLKSMASHLTNLSQRTSNLSAYSLNISVDWSRAGGVRGSKVVLSYVRGEDDEESSASAGSIESLSDSSGDLMSEDDDRSPPSPPPTSSCTASTPSSRTNSVSMPYSSGWQSTPIHTTPSILATGRSTPRETRSAPASPAYYAAMGLDDETPPPPYSPPRSTPALSLPSVPMPNTGSHSYFTPVSPRSVHRSGGRYQFPRFRQMNHSTSVTPARSDSPMTSPTFSDYMPRFSAQRGLRDSNVFRFPLRRTPTPSPSLDHEDHLSNDASMNTSAISSVATSDRSTTPHSAASRSSTGAAVIELPTPTTPETALTSPASTTVDSPYASSPADSTYSGPVGSASQLVPISSQSNLDSRPDLPELSSDNYDPTLPPAGSYELEASGEVQRPVYLSSAESDELQRMAERSRGSRRKKWGSAWRRLSQRMSSRRARDKV